MKSPTLARVLRLSSRSVVFFCLAPVLPLCAQVNSAQGEHAIPPKEDVLTLSPFEVKVEKDEGFVATSSLAGGRLAGDLKDTPVAYSVLTKDLIDALQLNDLAEMAQWLPSAAPVPDNGNATAFGSSDEVNLSTYRGTQTNVPQRNFFPFGFNFDSYNLERLDLARGANAILFGNGGFGGSPNAVTKRANPGRDLEEIKLTIGSWERYRAAADVNVSAGKNFAIRGNLLWSDRDGWRDFDFEKKRAATLSATWRPSKSLELRAEGEYGERDANVVVTRIGDRLSGWDGVSTFATRVTATPTNANQRGVARITAVTPVYNATTGSGTLVNYQNTVGTLGGNSATGVPVGGVSVVGPSVNIQSQSILYALNLPSNRFDKAFAGSSFKLPDREFTTSPNAPLRTDRYKNFTFGGTQKLTDNLYADAAVNFYELRFKGDYIGNRTVNNIWIDINENLPTGTPNPKFLQPYFQGPSQVRNNTTQTVNSRAALAYVANTSWGEFKFNLLGGASVEKQENIFNIYALGLGSDPRVWTTANVVQFRYYVDETTRSLPTPNTWSYVDPGTNTTTQVPANYYLSTANKGRRVSDYGVFSTSAKLFKGRLNLLGAVRRDYYESTSEAGQNLNDYALTWDSLTPTYRPKAPDDYLTLSYVPKTATGAPTGTATAAAVRPRASNGVPMAQYANDRFQDDYSPPPVTGYATTMTTGGVFHVNRWLSAFLNRGETFDLPPALSVDINGRVLPATTSESIDYGLRLSLLKDKMVVNLIGYTGKSTSLLGTGLHDDLWVIADLNVVGDLSSTGVNNRGLGRVPRLFLDRVTNDYSGQELEIVANITKSWRLIFNAARPRVEQTDKFKDTQAYLQANDTLLRQVLSDGGVIIDSNGFASVNPAIPAGQLTSEATEAADAWNIIRNVMSTATQGAQPSQRLTNYTGNIFTDYRFTNGVLKGLRVGGGFNVRGKQIIGFRALDTIRDPNNPLLAIDDPSVSELTPVYQNGYYTGTASIGYRFKVRKIAVNLDLKIDNLFNYSKPLYYDTILRPQNGDLSNPARVTTANNFGYIQPRSYSLVTTIRF